MSRYVNIISSDETLLQQEACDQLINTAKENGIHEREIVDVVDKFCWEDLIAGSQTMSLFSEQKLTDIRFSKSPKKDAQQALVELASAATQDNQLLIRLPKLEKRQKNTKWFKSLVKNASLQELWAPKPYAFYDWLKNRAMKLGVKIDDDALSMLAEQTEGNLLSASQALEKLGLLYKDNQINIDMLKQVSSDSARYSIFLCLDEALEGKGSRAVKMLSSFKREGVTPISILVNLTREIEYCTQVSLAKNAGHAPMQALSKTYLWDSKKKLILNASNRLPLAIWQRLSMRCAFLDRMVKGQEKGNIWQELESCLWLMSGKKIWGVKRA